jgi:hypothetical protein
MKIVSTEYLLRIGKLTWKQGWNLIIIVIGGEIYNSTDIFYCPEW